MSPRPLIGFFAGLSLGAAALWSLHRSQDKVGPASTAPSRALAADAAVSPASTTLALVLPARLSDAEADAALDAYLALPPLPPDASAAEIHARFTRLRALLTLLPASSFERLFTTLALRVGDPEARCRRIAFAVWTELDAPAAARWAVAIVPGEAINEWARASYLRLAALAWAETDFDAAYAWASALADTRLAHSLSAPLLALLAASDPTRALALARAQGDDFLNAHRAELFTAWADRDPAAAIHALGAELLAAKDSSRGVHQALAKWLARDSAAAFAWIQSQLDESRGYYDTLLYSVVQESARRPENIRAVADLLAAHPELPDQFRHLKILAINWPKDDPGGFVSWLKSQPPGERRARLAESLLPYLGSTDNFLAGLALLPPGPEREKRLADHLADWAGFSPESALAWIAAHDTPEVAAASTKIEGSLIAHLAISDPAAALSRWQAMPASAERNAAIGPIAASWAKTDPAAALRFLAEQTNTLQTADYGARNDLSRTAQGVASLLACQDPAALLRLAETLPAPDLRRSVYYALANDHDFESFGQVSTSVPHAARADLLATTPESEARAGALTVLLNNWLRRDYEAARVWIEAHDAVSPEAAAKLLEANSPDKTLF